MTAAIGDFPRHLYRLTDVTSQFVDGLRTSLRGSEKGRAFEHQFCVRCEASSIPITQRPGTFTLDGVQSASGLRHESDALIAWNDGSVHIELKHLSQPVSKYEVFALNQKGQDFLATGQFTLRRRPLYRMLVSGGPVSEDARRIALLWGIIVIEPGRPSFLELYRRCREKGADISHASAQFYRDAPTLIGTLQERVRRLAHVLDDEADLLSLDRCDRALRYQSAFSRRDRFASRAHGRVATSNPRA